MSEKPELEDSIYAMAQAVILFGPNADSIHEYTASEIAQYLNPVRPSHRHPDIIYESDLEAELNDMGIRNAFKKCRSYKLHFIDGRNEKKGR